MEPGGLIVLLALLALFWIFMIKPQRRRMNEQRVLHETVAVGDEIVTVGGLLGHVRGIDEDNDTLLVEIAPGTNVRVARRGVAAILAPEEGPDSEQDSGVRS